MFLNKRFFVVVFILLLTIFSFSFITPVYADGNSNGNIVSCNDDSLLGNPTDEESVAWIVQQALDVLKIAGPILVVVLTSIELVPIIMSGDDQAMSKLQKKLITRIILAVSLFFLPYLVSWLLDLFNITSSGICGLK